MKYLFIILSILLLSSPLFGQSKETSVLYKWKSGSRWVWKSFGVDGIQTKYMGEIKNGKPDGRGIKLKPDGGKYVGEFKDGLPNGQGTETFSNGEKYIGEFKDGKFHGQGTKTWSDGMYVGKYKDGKLWTGIFYDKNRNISFKVVNGRMIKQ